MLIVTPRGENGTGGIDRMVDVIRHHFARARDVDFALKFVVTRGPGSIVFSPFYFLRALATLVILRLRNQVDLVHINISQGGSALRKVTLAVAARCLGVPYVLHLHGSRFRQYWDSADPFTSFCLRGVFAKAARILVLGKAWSQYVRSKVPEGRIDLLPNATLAANHARNQMASGGAPKILFLGRIGARKGVPDLINALALLDKSLAWRATIVGDGAVEEARAQAAAQGVADRVSVHGWASSDEVSGLLAGSDILVLPSYDENLPLSVIEAMGYGLAVVTTPVGAIPDIIVDGETGLLTLPGDSSRLAEALTRVISDPSLRAKLGAAAWDFHARNLNVEVYIARLKDLWRMSVKIPVSACDEFR